MINTYIASFWGLWTILTTIILQLMIATKAHRNQPEMIPGIVDGNLGHESFVFRSDRTFRNSLENIGPMLGMSLLGILVGANATAVATCIWVYAISRIAHMVLYYKIATEKNPSPRSYFFLIGLFANIVLVGVVATALI